MTTTAACGDLCTFPPGSPSLPFPLQLAPLGPRKHNRYPEGCIKSLLSGGCAEGALNLPACPHPSTENDSLQSAELRALRGWLDGWGSSAIYHSHFNGVSDAHRQGGRAKVRYWTRPLSLPTGQHWCSLVLSGYCNSHAQL